MKIEEVFMSLDIVMRIGQDLLWIDDLLLDTVYSLEVILFHGKVRSRV